MKTFESKSFKHITIPAAAVALAATALTACATNTSLPHGVSTRSANLVPDQFVLASGARAYEKPTTTDPSNRSLKIAAGVRVLFKKNGIVVTKNNQKYLVVTEAAMKDHAGDEGKIPTNAQTLSQDSTKVMYAPLVDNHVSELPGPSVDDPLISLEASSELPPTVAFEVHHAN